MKLEHAQMEYYGELQRWVVDGDCEWYSLRCGEIFHLHIGGKSLCVRLEMTRSWYVIAEDVPDREK